MNHEKLRTFALEMKKGYQLVKENKNEEAIIKLSPYIQLMKESSNQDIRLYYFYCMAQFRTGNIDDFLESYAAVKDAQPNTETEKKLLHQLDVLFQQVMEELGNP